jgi:glycosyltransferase involved in cell wall biosynthesis
MPRLSIVVPVFRNVETLEELHRRLDAALKPLETSWEAVYVDDACPAGSLSVLEKLAALDPRVAVLSLERNAGQNWAVLIGLSHARGQIAVIMDADLQDPPEAIPLLLAGLGPDCAAVFAGRRGAYEPTLRLATSRVFKYLLHLLTGLPADAGIFVAMDRRMVSALLRMRERQPFVVAMMGCTGLPVRSIPVTRLQRPRGISAYSAWMRLRTGWQAVALVLSHKLGLQGGFGSAVRWPVVQRYIGSRFCPRGEQSRYAHR